MESMKMEKSIKEKKDHVKDEVVDSIGAFGKFQLFLFLLISLTKLPVAFFQLAQVFLAPQVSYVCPTTGYQSCPCPNPEYNKTVFTNTMVMQWNLICDDKWKVSFSQTMTMFGCLVGSIIFGMASDRFGRRKPLIAAVVLQMISGICTAFVDSYWGFTFLRSITGVTVGGAMVVGFVLLMEFVGAQHRDIVSALYQAPFNIGHMILALIGFLVRDFQELQLTISVPCLLMLIYFFVLPESGRWLIAVGRRDEAITLLEKVAKTNNLPVENVKPNLEVFMAKGKPEDSRKGNLLDLLRTPNLRKHTLIMAFDWLTCSYCFYGVSQYVGSLSSDPFLNVALSASLSLIGCLCSIPFMRFMGRKSIVVYCNIACALCLLAIALVPKSMSLLSVILACVGASLSFIVFVIVYIYAGELFPTIVRNNGIGICSMSARIGAMIAPTVIDLKDIAEWLPPVVFCLLPVLAGILTLYLPETKGCELLTTLEEGESFGKKLKP